MNSPTTPEGSPRSGQLELLTGLRGMAAFLVLVCHSAEEALLPSFLAFGLGRVGVMLFFVLSGFLMAHLYAERPFQVGPVWEYAKARIGRVVPLYLVVVTGSVAMCTVWPGFHFNFHRWDRVARALLFVNSPFVLWTIPVEVQFYGVFLAYWYLRSRGAGWGGLVAVCVLVTLPVVPLMAWFGAAPDMVPKYAFNFFVGCAIAMAYPYLARSPALRSALTWLGPVFLVAVLWNVTRFELWGLPFVGHEDRRVWGDPLVWTIVLGLFLSALLGVRSLRLLGWRPFVFLGEISYGLYLVHHPIVIHMRDVPIPLLVKFPLIAVLSILLAWISFRWFERPAAQRVRRWGVPGPLLRLSKVSSPRETGTN